MKKRYYWLLIFSALLALISSAVAGTELRLTSGANTITVVDGDANDQAPDAGVVYYNGPVGANWNINITVGTSKPADGTPAEPFIDLDTESLSQSAGDLKIEFTDTDFTATSGTFDAEAGGLSDGSVEFQYFIDGSNTPFGTSLQLADFPNQTDVYAASSNGTFSITAPYSLTVEALIHHTGHGSTGFDASLQLTPPNFQPPSVQCAGDTDLGCNPPVIPSCDTNSITITASCGVSNITCAAAGPDIITGCVHERDLVYTVTDNCGQSASCTQHIFWTSDTTPPTFNNCPGDRDLGCNPESIPDCSLDVTASDDCSPKAIVTCSSTNAVNGCAHTRTITYVATDRCGNKATCVQHITWTVDTTAPTFTKCAEDKNLGCNPATIPDCDTTSVAATDDCTANPTITCSSSDSADGCAHVRTITYIATDSCGNTASCVQHVTWRVDTTKPTFTTCAPDRDLGCNPATIPGCDTTSVAATDNCTANPTITCSSSDSADGCAHTRTITYVATDACGNTATCVQHITWTADTTNPIFTKCAPDKDLGCNPATIPGCDTSSVTATDNCGTPTVTCSSSDSVSGCSHTRTITYVATDACRNSASCVQHITWTIDVTPPTLTVCDVTNFVCGTNCANVTFSDNATDDCSTPVVIYSPASGSKFCLGTNVVTATATDACGNKTVKTFKLIIAVNPNCGGSLGHGDTATIGFWHNKNGQALINAMPSPGLGNYLASNYPCIFGNLLGASDATVAAQFLTYFNVSGQKTYAQVMAGALADYVTSTTLSGGTKAGGYGFNTSPGGTGGKSYNVGSNGTVLGLTNNTSYTVAQILAAAQKKCPWSSDVFNALNTIFDGINQGGDIN